MFAPSRPLCRFPNQFRRRPPERKSVTVCIAASCSQKNLPAGIILCHDWQGTITAVGSSESVDKQRWLADGWVCLISGGIAQADELTLVLEDHFRGQEITEKNVLSLVRDGCFQYRDRMVDQHLRSRYGIDFQRLAEQGKSIYPDPLLQQIHRELSDISIGVDLIITGFVEANDYEGKKTVPAPIIIHVMGATAGYGIEVTLQESFACIGEGGNSATAALLNREHSELRSLRRTAYVVYEAKTLTETISSVGRATSIYLQTPDNRLKLMTENGYDTCQEMFGEFGPKKLTVEKLKAHKLSLNDFKELVDFAKT